MSVALNLKRQETAIPPERTRTLTAGDIASLGLHPAPIPRIKRLRDSHHALARLIAENRPGAEISALTGYAQSSISILKSDPAFAELVEYYRGETREAYANLADRMALLSLDTIQELQDRLVNEPESFQIDQLQAQLRLLADRTGFGPTSKTDVQITVAGFADRLEEARRRVEAAKVIEHDPQVVE